MARKRHTAEEIINHLRRAPLDHASAIVHRASPSVLESTYVTLPGILEIRRIPVTVGACHLKPRGATFR